MDSMASLPTALYSRRAETVEALLAEVPLVVPVMCTDVLYLCHTSDDCRHDLQLTVHGTGFVDRGGELLRCRLRGLGNQPFSPIEARRHLPTSRRLEALPDASADPLSAADLHDLSHHPPALSSPSTSPWAGERHLSRQPNPRLRPLQRPPVRPLARARRHVRGSGDHRRRALD